MEAYKNAFDPHVDFMLWELHEIRHQLHTELSQKTLEEINRDALQKYQQWQRQPAQAAPIIPPTTQAA